MGDPLESMHQDEEADTFEEDQSDDPVNEGQTTEEGEAESQENGGEDTGCSTDQDVGDEDPSQDQTSFEVEDKDEDRSDGFRPPGLDLNRSFDPDNSLLSTDSRGGSLKDNESRQKALSQEHRGRIPTHPVGNSGPPKTSGGDSPMEVQRGFSCGPDPGNSCIPHSGEAKEAKATPGHDFDLSGFNSQFIQDDLERTVEAIRVQQRQFSVVDQVNHSIAQLTSQITQQG